jgi:DUF4097 and DUF4098 domain-containing protein YvlB
LFVASLGASQGCDVVTAEFKHSETAEWRKSYELAPGGRVEINNVNGRIHVEAGTGNAVEIIAKKTAKGANETSARQSLERIEIREDVSPSNVTITTKLPRGGGFFEMGGTQVSYTVRMPAGAEAKFTTVNGGVDVTGLSGRVTAETTNGGVTARDIAGTIEASTTNGGVDVDLSRLGEGGAKLECTNGGIKLRLPADSKATISASITNGGIDVGRLSLETSQLSRRRVEGRLNGGGAPIHIEGTNGGIRLDAR